MRRFPAGVLCAPAITVAILGLLSTGCDSLRTGALVEPIVLRSSPPAGLLEAIRASLGAESWRANRGWTAQAEWEHRQGGMPQPEDLRWTFGRGRDDAAGEVKPQNSDRPGTAKNGSTKEPEARAALDRSASDFVEGGAKQWDGFWPLTVSDLVGGRRTAAESSRRTDPVFNSGLDCLRRLAHGDDLVGWNAAILWAQHEPISAVEIAEVLEKIVARPMQYDVEPGDRATAANDERPRDSDKRPDGARGSKNKSASSADGGGKMTADSRSRRMRTTGLATRCAAAEAWCLVLAAKAPDPLDGLAPAGRLLERSDLPVEIRGELYRGVARWARPADIPRLGNALREGTAKERAPVEIRRAAIEACLVHAVWRNAQMPLDDAPAGCKPEHAWPETIMNCRIDPDVHVRTTFFVWLGVAQPPGAFPLLKAQAEMGEIGPRSAAMEGLGRLHTEAARAELHMLVGKTRDALKAAVVRSLAAWGLDEIIPFANDPSLVVRIAVAAELGKRPSVEAAVRLSDLAVDLNGEVQLAALRAVKDWPDSLALPLLLRGMRDSSAKARHEAMLQTARRRKFTAPYRFDAPPGEREDAVIAVATEIGSSLSYLDQILSKSSAAKGQVDALRAREIHANLAAFIENPPESPAAGDARDWLAGIGPRDVPLVEDFLNRPTRAIPDRIYRDVLPKVSPVYAALLDLESADVGVRRRGAQTLADRGRSATLGRPAVLRLRLLLANEADSMVWRSSIAAIASDGTEECAEVAKLALQHGLPEVREMGCNYLAAHGGTQHAAWLLDLLQDHSRSVQLAAIRALGTCGNPVAIRGEEERSRRPAAPSLRSFLASPDQEIRIAAAVSLCRLGATEGMQELMRLSYLPDAKMRARVVREMGLSGQTRFVDHLVTLGWTERSEQVRRAILESLDRLVPPENRPAGVGEIPASDAKIRCWAQWLRQRGGTVAADVPAGAPLASPPVGDEYNATADRSRTTNGEIRNVQGQGRFQAGISR